MVRRKSQRALGQTLHSHDRNPGAQKGEGAYSKSCSDRRAGPGTQTASLPDTGSVPGMRRG